MCLPKWPAMLAGNTSEWPMFCQCWLISVLANFRRLICPFRKSSCQIFPWILAWLVLEYVGNIESSGFCRKIIKRHFGLTLSLSRLHYRRSKNQWGSVSTIYERGQRSPTVVVGVVSPSSPGARPLLCTRERRSNDHHRRLQIWERNQWGRVSTIYERTKNPNCCHGGRFSFVPVC